MPAHCCAAFWTQRTYLTADERFGGTTYELPSLTLRPIKLELEATMESYATVETCQKSAKLQNNRWCCTTFFAMVGIQNV